MRIDVEGGTDIASIQLFWPSRVTEDVQAKSFTERQSWIAEQSEAKQLIDFPCNSDGSYKVAIFIDEDPPEELAEHLVDGKELGRFETPGESAWFGGFEGISSDPTSGKHRNAVNPVEIPAGSYEARLSEFAPPPEFEDLWIQAQLGPEGLATRSRLDSLLGGGGLLGLLGVGIGIFSDWGLSAFVLIGVALVLFALAALANRGEGSEQIHQANKAYEDRFASYVLRLVREGD